MNAEEFLTQKIVGPVPMWAVLGVAGGVVLLLLRGPGGGGGGDGETGPQLPTDGTAVGAGGDLGQGAGPVDYGAIVAPGSGSGGFEDPMPIVDLPAEPYGDPNPAPYDPITPLPIAPVTVPIPYEPPPYAPWDPVPDAPVYLPILAPIADSLIGKGVDPATGAFVGGGSVSSGPGGANAVGFGGTVTPIYPGTAAVATPSGMTAGGFFHANEGLSE